MRCVCHHGCLHPPPVSLPAQLQGDLYTSPSIGRTRNGSTPSGSQYGDGPPVGGKAVHGVDSALIAAGRAHHSPSPHPTSPSCQRGVSAMQPAPGTDDGGMIPFGVNFAQLNQEVRHIYSFAVIETARRVGDGALREAGGMQRVVDSASAAVPQVCPVQPNWCLAPSGVLVLQHGVGRPLVDAAGCLGLALTWQHEPSNPFECENCG